MKRTAFNDEADGLVTASTKFQGTKPFQRRKNDSLSIHKTSSPVRNLLKQTQHTASTKGSTPCRPSHRRRPWRQSSQCHRSAATWRS